MTSKFILSNFTEKKNRTDFRTIIAPPSSQPRKTAFSSLFPFIPHSYCLIFLSSLVCLCSFVCVLLNPLTLLSTGTKLINRNHHFLFLFSVCMCVCVFSVYFFLVDVLVILPRSRFCFSLPLFFRSQTQKTDNRKKENVKRVGLFCGCLFFFVIETTTTTT